MRVSSKMSKKEKKINIAIVGLGGQGIITLSKLITRIYFELGKEVTMNEIHGLAQRGGSVQSFLRVNEYDCPVFAYNETDFIIGLDKLETMRYLYLAREAQPKVLFTNKYDIRNTDILGIETFPKEYQIDEEIKKYSSSLYFFDALNFEKNFRYRFKPLNVAILSTLTEIPEFQLPKDITKKEMLGYLGRNIFLKRINELAFKQAPKYFTKMEK